MADCFCSMQEPQGQNARREAIPIPAFPCAAVTGSGGNHIRIPALGNFLPQFMSPAAQRARGGSWCLGTELKPQTTHGGWGEGELGPLAVLPMLPWHRQRFALHAMPVTSPSPGTLCQSRDTEFPWFLPLWSGGCSLGGSGIHYCWSPGGGAGVA